MLPDTPGMIGYVAGERHGDDTREEQNEHPDGNPAQFLVTDLGQQRVQPAQDEADEGRGGRQGIVGKEKLEQAGQRHDADQHTHGIGQKGFHALPELAEKMGDAMDQRVVNPHGHHHRAAGHAGDDVRHADDHAAQNLIEQFHSL